MVTSTNCLVIKHSILINLLLNYNNEYNNNTYKELTLDAWGSLLQQGQSVRYRHHCCQNSYQNMTIEMKSFCFDKIMEKG